MAGLPEVTPRLDREHFGAEGVEQGGDLRLAGEGGLVEAGENALEQWRRQRRQLDGEGDVLLARHIVQGVLPVEPRHQVRHLVHDDAAVERRVQLQAEQAPAAPAAAGGETQHLDADAAPVVGAKCPGHARFLDHLDEERQVGLESVRRHEPQGIPHRGTDRFGNERPGVDYADPRVGAVADSGFGKPGCQSGREEELHQHQQQPETGHGGALRCAFPRAGAFCHSL